MNYLFSKLNILSQPISEVFGLIPQFLDEYHSVFRLMLQSDACYVGAARRYSDHRGRSATFPVTRNRLRKCSIGFRVQPKCHDTTVADMPAFSIPIAWFRSSLFSLGIFFRLVSTQLY